MSKKEKQANGDREDYFEMEYDPSTACGCINELTDEQRKNLIIEATDKIPQMLLKLLKKHGVPMCGGSYVLGALVISYYQSLATVVEGDDLEDNYYKFQDLLVKNLEETEPCNAYNAIH